MKSASEKNLRLFVVYVISGTFFPVLFGILFKGFDIFIPNDPGFTFVVFGSIGAILFSTLRLFSARDFIFVSILICLITIVLNQITYFPLISARIIYFFSFAVSLYLYETVFLHQLKNLRFGKFLTLIGLISVVNLLMTLLIGPFIEPENFRLMLIGQVFYGFLIGAGLGIGFELADYITSRKLYTT
jgi:hypothetical protein